MSNPVLEARGIVAHVPGRGSRAVLDGLDFTVEGGESVAIVGRSGSGKSTLLTILGLLQPPSSGELRVLGENVGAWSDARRAKVRNEAFGFVFQDYALIRELDVRANLEMPLDYAGVRSGRTRRARVAAALERVGLAGFERERPGRMSGGEQQRVAVARALVTEPRIVLADEPTGALDTDTGDEIFALLKRASADAGSCLVVVTHDPLVAAGCDRVLTLDRGVLGFGGAQG